MIKYLLLLRVLTLYVINYATLIIALFEKLDNIRDSSRTFDDEDRAYYLTSPENLPLSRRPRKSDPLFRHVSYLSTL